MFITVLANERNVVHRCCKLLKPTINFSSKQNSVLQTICKFVIFRAFGSPASLFLLPFVEVISRQQFFTTGTSFFNSRHSACIRMTNISTRAEKTQLCRSFCRQVVDYNVRFQLSIIILSPLNAIGKEILKSPHVAVCFLIGFCLAQKRKLCYSFFLISSTSIVINSKYKFDISLCKNL